MVLKDYYQILELPPGAGLQDIKKSFRRLALRYHPDTNQGNLHAEAWYREVQEAYETLTNPVSREAYLQQRWLLKSQGKAFTQTMPLTPAFILKQAEALALDVKLVDAFRMDHAALARQIAFVIEDEKIAALLSFADGKSNRKIAATLLHTMDILHFKALAPLFAQLHKLAAPDTQLRKTISDYARKRRRMHVWEKYQGLFIVLLTLLLCLLIYAIG